MELKKILSKIEYRYALFTEKSYQYFLEYMDMKNFVYVFVFLFIFSLGSVIVFAAKGPCEKFSPGVTCSDVYESFPNPKGPEYDDVQKKVASYTTTVYYDDNCLNKNEVDCSYTQGALSSTQSGTIYTYEIINGEYIVTETITLPVINSYTRKTC